MMKFGLTDNDFHAIVETLQKFPHVEKASIFGSRALGTHHAGSDIDLAVFGKSITHNNLLEIRIALEDLELLNKIDLVHFESLTNPDFVEHIKRVGINLFPR